MIRSPPIRVKKTYLIPGNQLPARSRALTWSWQLYIFVIVKIRNFEIFKLHADYCRVLANPKRLMILALLAKRELSVSEIAASIDTPLPTVSQHLSLLRSKNVVETRKDGQNVYYRPSDPRLMDACELIRTVLLDGMKRRGEIATETGAEDLIAAIEE